MIKNILAAAIVVALGACSSSDSDDDDTNTEGTGGQTENGTGTVTGPAGGGEGPITDTKAGSYVGNFGGADGVYVINNDFRLAGLAISPDGSAQSLFGNLGDGDTFTGELAQYLHQESRPDGAAGSFGAVASLANPLSIDVTIVNGQTITSTAESATSVALLGTEGSSVAPATEASLAGTWSGVHSFCADDEAGEPIDCQLLTTSLTFSGTDVTGSTVITNAVDVSDPPIEIAGGITEFGHAALIDFTWGDSEGYSGVVFFTPSGDGRVAFVGQNPGNEGAPTISAVMNKQ